MSVDRLLGELELLEALDRDGEARSVVMRIGRLAHEGRLEGFRRVVREDEALDEETRSWVLGLARNEAILVDAHGYAEWVGVGSSPGLQFAPRGRLAQSVRAPL